MLKNYLRTALRNLNNQKVYSFINIFGLCIGISCCVLMLLYVQDELTFDQFHQQSDLIYRVVENRPTPSGEEEFLAYTIGPTAQALVDDFPEIVKSVRIRDRWGIGRFTVGRGENRFYEGDFIVTEPSFFEVFDFELLRGNPNTALSEPNSVVLTTDAAKKYFGDRDPVNQTLRFEGRGDFKVTGLLANPPKNSHLDFNMIISLATLLTNESWAEFTESWRSTGFSVYVVAGQPLDLQEFNPKLPALVAKYRGAHQQELRRDIALQPLSEIHFQSGHIEAEHNMREGNFAYIYIFSAVALFVLLIACINYMNLATARSSKRAREVGMRKVVGAQRWQVIGQLISESVLSALISLILAVAIVQLLLPSFNELADKDLVLDLTANPVITFSLIGLVVLVGVLSGSYPALYLSALRPAAVFHSAKRSNRRHSVLRRILVVTQFALSVIMIVATIVALQQLNYIRNKNLGFRHEEIVVVDINSGGVRSSFQNIKTEMARVPSVQRVAVSSRVPGEWKNITRIDVVPEGAAETSAQNMYFFAIDEDFLATYDMQLVAGRNISSAMGTDTSAVLLNETAVAALGWQDPLGKRLRVPDSNYDARVIGVVKDFHFQSLHENIAPLVMGHWNNPVRAIDYFSCRVVTDDIQRTLADLQSVHEAFDQVTPFEYNFLAERLRDFYETDRRVGKIFGITAGMAIFIACLGLFGLSAFIAEQRTKEIGVRKVLGASVANLIGLLSRDFVILVIAANLIAWPLAWYAMNRWLQDFAYHIDIGWTVFGLTGGIALVIALITVSSQAIKAALANPVESLRYE